MKFKLGMKTVDHLKAVFATTKEEIEKVVNEHLDNGWHLNGDTIYHKNGYTQPLKKFTVVE